MSSMSEAILFVSDSPSRSRELRLYNSVEYLINTNPAFKVENLIITNPGFKVVYIQIHIVAEWFVFGFGDLVF